MADLTPDQQLLVPLISVPEFWALIQRWVESNPIYSGVVTPENLPSVNYRNGRAFFVHELVNELRVIAPAKIGQLAQEKPNVRTRNVSSSGRPGAE